MVTVSRRTILGGGAAAAAAALTPAAAASATARVERWGLHEIVLDGPAGGNPFDDVTLAAIFTLGTTRIVVPGFYDGDGTYRIRFSPPSLGRWTWTTASNVAALDGRSGAVDSVPPSPGNHGPVRMTRDGYHFVHADGTPYRPVGTTAYSWALQSDAQCARTLATLKVGPFNKIRMCVFPNVASVATDPFVRTGGAPRDWDPARFDPAYFRRFEDRLRRLGELGIEADVILFHPYDKRRGYSAMRRSDDERYVRYVAARFGAFRHVWWAMANEYDIVEDKTVADWDHLFAVLVAADPHDRLRSIHQLNVYYDHRKPWITHASIQHGAAVLDDGRVHPHRNFAQKAVIFDEVIYEGNSDKRWARLTGEQLVERFWWGTLGGAYVGHGEVFTDTGNPDQSWLGQGGSLRGTSPPRLAFLNRILASVPSPGIDPIQQFWDYHLGGRDFTWYLKYFGSSRPTRWDVALPTRAADPHPNYRIDILDTWNMTITPVDGVFRMVQRDEYDVHDPARPSIALPGKPYIALRITKV
ncbi:MULTISPECIES: DUF5060 domain-containing protein [unclassified Sphingomonas]|uniref:DUF5060 domain-containing protein n=1 Tax=unclassified Sphingomonas TaxID=196159 RepID=UPI000B11DD2B|nr:MULTISPECIES: DUF5060 domain-containing protein [unclassified Sphingomonas]